MALASRQLNAPAESGRGEKIHFNHKGVRDDSVD